MRAEVVGGTNRLRHLLQVLQLPTELLLDGLSHALRPIVVHHELEARFRPREAVAQVSPPHIQDCLRDRQRIGLRNEDVQIPRDARGG